MLSKRRYLSVKTKKKSKDSYPNKTKGGKDSSSAIKKKLDYVAKLETMIHDGIIKGTYIETTDNTLKELSRFQDFLYRNIYNYEHYKDMKPDRNQPARF